MLTLCAPGGVGCGGRYGGGGGNAASRPEVVPLWWICAQVAPALRLQDPTIPPLGWLQAQATHLPPGCAALQPQRQRVKIIVHSHNIINLPHKQRQIAW